MKKELQTRRIGFSDDPTAARPTLQDCLNAVIRQAPSLIDQVLKGLGTAFDQAQKTVVHGSQPPGAKLAIEHLVLRKDEVKASFVGLLRSGMYGGGVMDGYRQPLVRFEDLQTLEEEQLDENIEVARAQQEVEAAVDVALPQLDALMSTLMGWVTVQPQLNPLRPEIFVRALRECLAKELGDTDVRGVLIGPAGGAMGVSLRKLYMEMSGWLMSHGIEPAGVRPPTNTPDSAARTTGVGESVKRTQLTLDRLRRLLSGELEGAEGAGLAPGRAGHPDFLHTVPASIEALQDMKQVEAMVERLAKSARKPAAAAAEPTTGPERVEAIKARRAMLSDKRQFGKQIGQEVARLMLYNLTHDERLMPRVREVLDSLESRLLALAHADSRFFSDRQHPARQFLDRVTHRSLAYASEHDDGFWRFMKSVEDAVTAINDTQSEGLAAFMEQVHHLEQIWTAEDEVQRQRREEAARALLHAEQRNLLAQRHAAEFRERAMEKGVPSVVIDFLSGPWAHVVAESELHGTEANSDPQGYLSLVDDLMWSVEPRAARRNRTRLVQLIPGLLGKLRHGLQLISYPTERIAVFFDELISLHEAALEGARAKPAAAPAARPGRDAAQTASAPDSIWLAEHEAAESGFMEEEAVVQFDVPAASDGLPEGASDAPRPGVTLKTGSWVELQLNGNWVRAQLTWASPYRTLFMFTSAGGLAHSMSRRTMERLLGQGQIRVVSEGNVVDNALDAVASQALRNTVGRAK